MIRRILTMALCVPLSAILFAYAPSAHAQPTQNEIDIQIHRPQPRISIPGLQFSSPEAVQRLTKTAPDGNTYLSIPYLGEYLAAVYRYLIVIISLQAVSILIIHGFGLLQAKGDSEKVERVKTRIAQTLTGLFLAIGSYAMLYLINPELVRFRNLQVLYVPAQVVDIEGEPDTLSARQQGMQVRDTPLDPSACHLEQFPAYAAEQTNFGAQNGYCLRWVKRSVNNACGYLPSSLDAVGAWDVAAQFAAKGTFHPCTLEGIQNGDIVFMTSIGSHWIRLWDNFRLGPNGCTIANAATQPTAFIGGKTTPTERIRNAPSQGMPPVTHIGVFYNDRIYHLVDTVAADSISQIRPMEDRGVPPQKKQKNSNWTNPNDVTLTGLFVGAEFISGYGSWR